jgi:hypothetical protein
MENNLSNDHNPPSHDSATPRHDAAQHDNIETHQGTVTAYQDKNQEAGRGVKPREESNQFYTLSVSNVRKMLIDAGHIVSERTLIRWCAKELLDATLRPEENGQYEKYYITESSVLKRIDQLDRVRPVDSLLDNQQRYIRTSDSNLAKHQVGRTKEQDASTPVDDMSRHGSSLGLTETEMPNLRGLQREVQELNDQLSTKNVDIQIRDKLLIREKEATREAWNKIAEIGEQVGRWKTRCERLELNPPTQINSDGELHKFRQSEIKEFEKPPQMDMDEEIGEMKELKKAKDAPDEPESKNHRKKRFENFQRYALYSIITILVLLMALAFIIWSLLYNPDVVIFPAAVPAR